MPWLERWTLEKVLLHFPDWRTDPYDENYPRFVPSEGDGRLLPGHRRAVSTSCPISTRSTWIRRTLSIRR